MQCAIEKLFAGAFGISYPPEDAERKIHDTLLLKKINMLTKRKARDVFEQLDETLMQKVFQKRNVVEYILEYGQDKEILEFIQQYKLTVPK